MVILTELNANLNSAISTFFKLDLKKILPGRKGFKNRF